MCTFKPLVSVVIPAYNEERYLKKTLLSLQKQNYPNFEVIVVDNHSRDQTAAVALASGARVIYEPRQGVAHARQAGFLTAQGEIIATTDADTIVPQDWLMRIANSFAKTNDIIAISGVYRLYSGSLLSRLTIALLLSWLAPLAWLIGTLGGKRPFFIGSCAAVRKESFLSVGGFNTNLRAFEDWDLGIRLGKIGRVVFDPFLIVYTSGRRFNYGLITGISHYLINFFLWSIVKKEKLMKFYPIRKECSPVMAMLAFSFAIIFCFSGYNLAFHAGPTAQAKLLRSVSYQIKRVKDNLNTAEIRFSQYTNTHVWKRIQNSI